jgi:hypothetical protein
LITVIIAHDEHKSEKEEKMDFDYEYANYVDDNGVAEIQALEKETGTAILAYTERPFALFKRPHDQSSNVA